MRIKWIAVLVASCLLTGCGDSPEHKMLLADKLLKTQPDKALELADDVLRSEPSGENGADLIASARLIKAQAQLALNQFEASKETFEKIKDANPDNPEPIRMLGRWAIQSMNATVRKSEFPTSLQLQTQFDNILSYGESQADLLNSAHKLFAESEMLRARLITQAVAAIDRLQKDEEKKTERLQILGDDKSTNENNARVQDLKRQITRRNREIETHLSNVLREKADDPEAVIMYLNLLTAQGREGWKEAMELAVKVSESKEITAVMGQQVAMAVLRVPDPIKPKAERTRLAELVLDPVPEAQRKTPAYLLARTHVLLTRAEPGDTDKALLLLDQIRGADRDTQIETDFLMAWCLMQQNKHDRALLILDKLEIRASNSVQVLILHAQALMKANDLTRAEEQVRRALDIDPSNTQAILLAADITATKGQTGNVRNMYQKIYESDPSDPLANRMLINEYISRDDKASLARHLAELERGVANLRDEHVALLIDGYSFLKRNDKVLYYADQIRRRRPDQLAAHLKYAEALMSQGADGPARAAAYIESIKTRFPEAATGDLMMGQLLMSRGQNQESEVLLSRFVKQNPENIEGRLSYARALAASEKIEESQRELREVLALEPANLQAHAMLGRIELFLGNTDEAGKHIAQIDETQVDEIQHPALKAQIMIQKDRLAEARNVCNQAVGRGNNDPVLRLLLARIYTLEKKPEGAEVHLLELARSQPNNLQVYRLLGEFYASNPPLQSGGELKLKDLQKSNDAFARMALATMFEAQGKGTQAITLLNEVYAPLLAKKDPQAFEIANSIARAQLRLKDLEGARETFKKLQDAGIMVKAARLRQIDLTWATPSVHFTSTQLTELSKDLTPEDEGLRSQVLARYARLDQRDQAMTVLEQWIAASPEDTTLLRWKGELLGQMGRYNDSVATYRQAIDKDPKKLALRARLVSAHLQNFDFPAAESELRKLADMDVKSRAMAWAELGQLYVRLGLNREASKAFEELERVSKVTEPNLLFAMGRAQAAIGLYDQARERLSKVPSFARLYPSAQVELARMEMRGGLQSQAKDRITALINDARTRARCMSELLNLNPYDRKDGPRDSQLMQWADDSLRSNPEYRSLIPVQLQSQWMRIRVILMDRTAKSLADYEMLLATLDEWQRLEPKSIQIFKGRLAVLARMDQQSKARQLFRSAEGLATTVQGPLLAVVVGDTPQRIQQRAALPEYFVALATGKPDAAKAAAEVLETRTAIYQKDMLSILDRPDITSHVSMGAARQLATAVVALDAGLPHLSAALSQNIIDNLPHMTPAHSLLAQALLSQGMSLEAALERAKVAVPNAGITAYLTAETRIEAGDYKTAAEQLVKLLSNEPNNIHARYRLAQVYQLANQFELSIQILEKMHADGGDYRIMVANDLAYLLATHSPERIENEAHGIAKRAQELVELQGGNALGAAALLDTVGWIESLRGNHAAAIGHLSRSIVSLSDRPEVHYHIGVVYDKLGNRTWARYHMEQAAAGDAKLNEVTQAKELLAKWVP